MQQQEHVGFGLFAANKKIKAGEKIGKYTGGKIRSYKLDKYYGKNALALYAICDNNAK